MDDAATLPAPGRTDRLLDRHVRRQPALLPGRRHRPPRGVRHRQRRRHRRRHAALHLRGLRARGGPRRSTTWSGSSTRWPPRPRRRASASSPATPRSSRRATATASTSTPPAWACCADGVDLSGSHCKAGDVILLSGTLGDHGIAVISQREGLSFGTDVEVGRRAAERAVRRGARGRAGRALLPRPHARRSREHAERARGRLGRLDDRRRRRPCPCASRCAAPARCSATTSSRSPTRARWSPSSRPSRPRRRWRRCAAAPYGEDAAIIGEVASRAGRQGLRADRLRRETHHGHARRRAAAPDLLRAAPSDSSREARASSPGPLASRGRGARGRARAALSSPSCAPTSRLSRLRPSSPACSSSPSCGVIWGTIPLAAARHRRRVRGQGLLPRRVRRRGDLAVAGGHRTDARGDGACPRARSDSSPCRARSSRSTGCSS